MLDKRKLGVLAAILLFLITAGAAFVVIKSYVWSGEPADLPAAPSNSAAVPATEPQPYVMPDFSKLKPRFTSADFRRDAVIMNNPHGKIASKAGVYSIESSPGTFWVWNRPWGNMYSDFACEVVGRVASGAEGAWSLYLTSQRTPHQGICITLHGDGTLEIGQNPFADQNIVETHVPPFSHSAIKLGTEFNRLLIVLRGQELTVLVNGVSVCEPLQIQEHVLPGVLALSGSAGPDGPTRVEFTSCTVWRAGN
ncbi:MAG: hypothetical protein ABSB74_05955 [Tepidisphaeraceae bacterium]